MYLKETAITLPVGQDWYGRPLDAEFRFILQIENDSILFGAQFPPDCLSLGSSGQFIKGLWEASVVELFIHEINNPRYFEINLSPTGAYWMAEFSDYRIRKAEIDIVPKIETKTIEGVTTVYLKISTKELINCKVELAQTAILKFGKKRANDTLYLSRKFAWRQSAQETLYCEPDFHKKKLAEVF